MGFKHIPTVSFLFSRLPAPQKQPFGISEMQSDSPRFYIQSIPEAQDTPENRDISENHGTPRDLDTSEDHNALEDRNIPEDNNTPDNEETPAEQVATQIEDLSEEQYPLTQYLHLCINRKSLPIMSSIEVGCLQNDQYLFQAISQEYHRVRRDYEWRISLLVPSLVRKLSCTVFAPLARLTAFLVELNSIQQLFHTISQCHLHRVGSGDFVQVGFQCLQLKEG